jgi:hypothetical protein
VINYFNFRGFIMKRIKERMQSERGQSIVLIAIVLMGLLAMAGLAVDGGNLFLQRRNAQNASDAASLAGTRQLARAICGEGATDAEVTYAVNQYAELNGVEDPSWVVASYVNFHEDELGPIGTGNIPTGATGVTVRVEDQVQTFFIRVVGIDQAEVSARATAMTGPALSGGGLRPIGIPIEMMWEMDMGESFRINFGNCDQHPEECIVSYTGGQVQHRGWLNLAYVWNDGRFINEDPDWPRAIDPSGDASNMKDWMESGYPGPALWWGDYIHAKPGQNASVIGETPGDKILVPIFFDVPHYDDIPGPKPPPASQGGGYYYHIAGFMAFEVTGVSQGGGWIDGTFVNAILGGGQIGTGEKLGFGQANACWSHAQVVNLVR